MILSCVIFLQRLCLFKWENISICIKKKVIILFYPTLFICIVKYWLCLGSYFSLLITATGHIKLTDFGLSKIGLMSCKCFFIAVLCMNKIADIFAEVTFFWSKPSLNLLNDWGYKLLPDLDYILYPQYYENKKGMADVLTYYRLLYTILSPPYACKLIFLNLKHWDSKGKSLLTCIRDDSCI